MSRTVYVNGSFVPEQDAKISIFDRAFLFAEGVYEVTAVLGGRPIDLENHLARLDRSLAEMEIASPLTHAELRALHAELIALNKVEEGIVYLEISRGVVRESMRSKPHDGVGDCVASRVTIWFCSTYLTAGSAASRLAARSLMLAA